MLPAEIKKILNHYKPENSCVLRNLVRMMNTGKLARAELLILQLG